MLAKLLGFLGSGPAEQIGEYFVQKAKLKQQLKLVTLQGKIALQTAKVKAAVQREEHINSWEMASLAKHSGYKDDVVMFVILAPYVGAFIPGIQDYVLVGFEYLAQMPYWAVGLTVTICLAIYGIRHRNASSLNAPGLRDSDVASK